jgi:cysteine desulfurase/selenocysteine lyase
MTPTANMPENPVRPLDVESVRADFPILARKVNGKPLVYLDNAATGQKPQCVIDALVRYYTTYNANVHRGVHALSQEATAAFEESRETTRAFLNAASLSEIVFVRGCTEAMNLVAQSYGRANLRPGDEVLVTQMEHHSNIVPWQMVCQQTGAKLRVIPMDDRGALDLEAFEALLSERTRIVSVTHISNALGTINPVKWIVERAHAAGAVVAIDGAQAVPHLPVDVRDLGADFYAFSSHKAFGPTGMGVLYGREALLEAMPPWQGGGDMIRSVSLEKSTWNDLPHKFEAGTPNIADAIAMAEALRYMERVGREAILAHEHDLSEYAAEALASVDGLRLVGTAPEKTGVFSFLVDGVAPLDLGTLLDLQGIAVRVGQHCAEPVMTRMGIHGTVRASLAFYNTRGEVDALVAGIRKAVRLAT